MKRKIVPIFLVLIANTAVRADESWLGIYMGGAKIGYAGTVTKDTTWNGKPALKSWSVNVLKAEMLGSSMEMHIESTTWSDAKGAPQHMEMLMRSEGRLQTITADFKGKKIELVVDNSGQKTKKILEIPEGMKVVDDPTASALDLMGKKVGQSYPVLVLDPVTASLVRNDIVYTGRSRVKVRNDEFSAEVIEVRDPRATTKVYLSSKGDLIKVDGPVGMEMYPEPKTVAQKLTGTGATIDLAEATRVRTNQPIERSYATKKVELRVTGIDLGRIVSDDQQVIRKDGEGWSVTVQPKQAGAGVPLDQAAQQQPEYLKPSMLITCDAPGIQDQAKKITLGAKTTMQAAERVRQYVLGLMQPNTGIGVLRDATEVISTKEGLCRDHAVLSAALMRAAGVPARLASGLIYADGAYYYHAWAEAWNGTQWIGFDSTRPESQFSAAHLRLAVGNVEEAFLFFVLSGAKIEVKHVDYR